MDRIDPTNRSGRKSSKLEHTAKWNGHSITVISGGNGSFWQKVINRIFSVCMSIFTSWAFSQTKSAKSLGPRSFTNKPASRPNRFKPKLYGESSRPSSPKRTRSSSGSSITSGPKSPRSSSPVRGRSNTPPSSRPTSPNNTSEAALREALTHPLLKGLTAQDVKDLREKKTSLQGVAAILQKLSNGREGIFTRKNVTILIGKAKMASEKTSSPMAKQVLAVIRKAGERLLRVSAALKHPLLKKLTKEDLRTLHNDLAHPRKLLAILGKLSSAKKFGIKNAAILLGKIMGAEEDGPSKEEQIVFDDIKAVINRLREGKFLKKEGY